MRAPLQPSTATLPRPAAAKAGPQSQPKSDAGLRRKLKLGRALGACTSQGDLVKMCTGGAFSGACTLLWTRLQVSPGRASRALG